MRKAIGPLSSMALPDNSEVEWIFEKHPALAGGLNVINSSRVVQVNVRKVFMAWTSKDNVKHRFVMDGFGKHLEALQQARSDAETFKAGANEVLLKLQNANTLQEFSECRPMAEMLAVSPFGQELLADSGRRQHDRFRCAQMLGGKGDEPP